MSLTHKPVSSEVEGEALAFIWKHVERIGDCMLVTNDQSELVARPMRGLIRQQDHAIWFITSKSTHKSEEVARNPKVCLCYVDRAANTYISLSGRVDLSDDKAQIRELWNIGADAYFPKGPDDPDVVLLRFTPETGEYWDAPSNPVVLAIQFIKAKVSGEPPKVGENQKVAMG